MIAAFKIFLSIFMGVTSSILPHTNHSLAKNQTAVKGISVSKSPTNSVTPTITVTTMPSPTARVTLVIKQSTQKQYGAWYWQSQLNKAQIWIGTDSTGKDIFIDHLPTPTLLPTKTPSIGQETYTPHEGLPTYDTGGADVMIQVKKIEN